ncbi:MAG: response regulator [Bacteroidota bacterium]
MTGKINILLVEDEFITLDNLKDTITDLGYAVSGTAMRADKAISILEKGKTDFAILDINIKGEDDGIWIGEQIQKKYQIPFIYLTAYTDSATIKKAATTQPAGYLVKPFTEPSVFAAIEMALSAYQPPKISTGKADDPAYIFIRENKVYKKLVLSKIRYIEAFKNYLEINLKDGRHIIRSTLRDFMKELPTEQFIQTHRSFVVNKNYVKQVSSENVILSSREIPITKTYREQLLEVLGIE